MPRLGAPHPTSTTSARFAMAPPSAAVAVEEVAVASSATESRAGKRRSASSDDDARPRCVIDEECGDVKAEAFDERSATMACCNAIDDLMVKRVMEWVLLFRRW